MSGQPGGELTKALSDLALAVQKRRRLSRHDARAVLIQLGQLLLAAETAAADLAVERLASIVGRDPEPWRKAVAEELVLACTEHAQSVDPRFLDHAQYDFGYTIAARADLEARLRAAERLDLAPSEDLLNRVARADALLAPYLRGKEGLESSN